MILLLVAGLLGWLGGMVWARSKRRPYRVPDLRLTGLVVLAFLPQFFAFVFSGTREQFPDAWVPLVLLSSQALLLVFVGFNIKRAGLPWLGLGLLLNLLVIALNGGMMPISPETLRQLYPAAAQGAWQEGLRFGIGKDIVLPVAQTNLAFLSDTLTLPGWFPYKLAFSVGDILIAAGAMWFLLRAGGPVDWHLFTLHPLVDHKEAA